MRIASIDVKTNHGTYKMYRVVFNDVKHYDNWCSAISKWGYKIIGVRFDDGYPGIDGFKLNQTKEDE
tara:strand:+ start:1162 stop:1362 length:201 start_codon:yes stop_codon:yes gene_type:complete